MECPVCQGLIVQTNYVFECENRCYDWKTKEKTGCDFIIFKQLLNKKISRPTFEKLLSGQKIQIAGFKNRANKKFDAKIRLGKNGNEKWKIILEFNNNKLDGLEEI